MQAMRVLVWPPADNYPETRSRTRTVPRGAVAESLVDQRVHPVGEGQSIPGIVVRRSLSYTPNERRPKGGLLASVLALWGSLPLLSAGSFGVYDLASA